MRVENAWCFSTGANIRVAIIDDGVDLSHPDLQANLLPGFDATGNNSGGAPTPTNSHGTNCAGIISSINNTIGTIGVAHNAQLIPIRMGIVSGGFFNTNDTWQANCFNEAVNRGADVISNSWGGGSQSAQLNAAITNATNNGRNGRGCVVLFSAGNRNAAVLYPATNVNVIAVGASTPCDTRKRSSSNPGQVNPGVSADPEGTSCDGEVWWGSNFGSGLDVIAPGVLITTTDNVGTNGTTSTDYNGLFNGTSAACPNAAGVIALILSVNPNITGIEARNILETTCNKVGGYYYSTVNDQPNGIWSNQAGYGRVNAFAALESMIQLSYIQNSCNEVSFNYEGVIASSYTWTSSNGDLLFNGTSTTITTTSPTVTATGTGGGVYVVTNNLCGNPIARNIDYYPASAISFQYVSSMPLIGNDHLSVNINEVQYAYNYKWYINGSLVQTGNSLNYCTCYGGLDRVQCGNNTIEVIAETSCGVNVVGSDMFEKWCYGSSSNISIYPNPAVSNVTLVVKSKELVLGKLPSAGINNLSYITEVRIFDQQGNVKMQQRYPVFSKQATINISTLPSDIYFIEVSDGKKKIRLPLNVRK